MKERKVRVVTVVDPADRDWLLAEAEREGSDVSSVLRRVVAEARGKGPKRANRKWERFEQAIQVLNRTQGVPFGVIDALVYVNDTLDECFMLSESVFGDDSTPEIAFAIYDRVESERKRLIEAEAERQRLIELDQ